MELVASNYIEQARYIKKYKAQAVYMARFSREFVFGMIEYFGIPEDAGDCENCMVVDWIEENDISSHLALGNQSYVTQVDLYDNARKFKKKCVVC